MKSTGKAAAISTYHRRSCRPCKRRKSRCGRLQPCPACVFHQTESECYVDDVEILGRTAASSSYSTTSPLIRQSLVASTQGKQSQRATPEEWPSTESTPACTSDSTVDASDTVQLPSFQDCKKCCDLYMTDLRWYIVHVDELEYVKLWDRLFAGETRRADLAFVYVTMALVGMLAPSADLRVRRLSYVEDAAEQKRYLQGAKNLLLDDERSQDVVDESGTDNSDIVFKANIHILISTYLSRTRNFTSALRHLQQSIAFAKTAGAYDDDDNDDEATEQASVNADDQDRRKKNRLRLDIWLLDAYLAFRLKYRNSVFSERCFLNCHTSQDSPIAKDYLQLRIKGIMLVEKVMSHLYSPTTKLDIQEIATLDSKLINYTRDSYSFDIFEPNIMDSNLDTYSSFQKAFVSHTIQTWAMALRCQLLQPLLTNSQWFSPACGAALAAAYRVLFCVPLNLQLLKSPWQKIASTKHGEVSIEVAMSIYATLLQRNDVGLGAMKSNDNIDLNLQMVRSHLKTFTAHFEKTYYFLNAGGFLGPSTLKCAELLRLTPVQRPLSDQYMLVRPLPRMSQLNHSPASEYLGQETNESTTTIQHQFASSQFNQVEEQPFAHMSWGSFDSLITMSGLASLMEQWTDSHTDG